MVKEQSPILGLDELVQTYHAAVGMASEQGLDWDLLTPDERGEFVEIAASQPEEETPLG